MYYVLQYLFTDGALSTLHYLQYLLTDDALRPVPEAVRAGVVPPLTNQRWALWSRDRSPPITAHLVDVPLLVELLALVVEAVRDLVSNHHTDASKIQGFGEKLKISLQPWNTISTI